ncbi:MAG: type II secretion system F family protein [Acidimicrobiales bacterium]|nr:type II secretion system F family protein [Aquihabitans sp.]
MSAGPAALAAAALVVLAGIAARPPSRRLGPRASRPRSARSVLVGLRGRWRASDDDVVGEVLRLRGVLASGGSTLAAVAAVAAGGGPWAAGATGVVRRARAGSLLLDALEWWADDGGEEVRLVADAFAIASATGGSAVGALDAVVATLEERRSLRREVRALSSQATASSVVLVAAPVAFAILVALVDPRVRRAYVTTAAGPATVVGGLALDAVGAWWMASLVRRVR